MIQQKKIRFNSNGDYINGNQKEKKKKNDRKTKKG